MAEQDVQFEETPVDTVGTRLRQAREAAGLSLADVAARTKIAERHLLSIEQSRFEALASRTYAVGFARAYARAISLDEAVIAEAVREELAASDSARQPRQLDAFEPGDPARVPGSRLAWLAGLVAVAVIVLVFINWRSFFSPAVSLPELTAPEATGSATAAPNAGPAQPPPAAGAPVVFTALAPDVWVKFYDAAGNQLMQKQMAQGESYTVPADANGPMVRTARPDALQITVGGRIVPKLDERSVSVKDIPVTAAALLARGTPAAQAPVAATPAPQPSASPQAAVVPVPSVRPSPRPSAAASPAPRPSPTAAVRRTDPASPAPASPAPPAATPAPPPAAVETSPVSN